MAPQLSILNPEPKILPGPSLLHHLVPRRSDIGQPAIDYLCSDGSIEKVTYEQLHQRANAVAQILGSSWKTATSTSKPAHFIAPILIPQCIELYVSELAALKAGAAFCPISLDIPEERLRFILNDIDAKVLLTTDALRTRLPDLGGLRIISVDAIVSKDDHNDVEIDIAPSQPAYVMYTSGSTGQPKGVILSHFAATQSLLAHDRHIPAFSRFLQFASPTFDVSVFEIFFPLFRGRTVVAGQRRLLLNDLPGFINRMDVDAAELTPSVASTLLRGKAGLPSLRTLLTIGEMLKREVVEEFGSTAATDGILHGMYGPTEAAIHCTLQTSFSIEMATSNIGSPLDTVSAFVIEPSTSDDPVNGDIEILPIGEEGELAIGGHQLADGYINRQEQTAASFINHPEYGRLYRTGDRARLASCGHLECSGRISSGQVKLRGQRVELGEIEYAASTTPDIRSAIADVYGGSVVVFCVTNTNVTTEQIRQSCQKWLPSFMMPTHYIILPALPYLSSGKVDRKALRELYDNHIALQLDASKETNENTSRIIDIVSNVLQVPINKQTRLSAVGIDSLSSIRIASQLRRAGFPQLDAMVLLECETVQDVESRITKPNTTDESLRRESIPLDSSPGLRDAVTGHATLSARLDQIEDVFAPTAVQLAMLGETAKDQQAYCNWVELRVTGHEIDGVRMSLQDLVSHHALLRSGFLLVNDSSTPYATIVWKTLPSEHLYITDGLDYGFSIRSEEDLLYPCRFQLIEDTGSVRILIQIHHALYDQWSIDILRCDLETLLDDDQILAPSSSFREVSAIQHVHRQQSLSQRSIGFWQDLLEDFVLSPLPFMNGNKVSKKVCRTPWRKLTLDLPSIRRKAHNLGCSVPAMFQTALSYMLGNYCGNPDVTFGVVVSGRHISVPGIEGVFGPCLATLPFRIDCSTHMTRSDLLREVQARNRELQKHALTPLTDIKQVLELSADDRLFNTLFVWQKSTLSSTGAQNLVQELDSCDQHEFDLVTEFEPTEEDVRIRVTYQRSMIGPDQIEILIQQLRSVSEAIINAPDASVSSLVDCLPRYLRSTSNPAPVPNATTCNLIAAIENHAVRDPNSPAIVFANAIGDTATEFQSVNYNELDKRSNRMARFLRSWNILPDEVVCICMEKSVDLYAAILGTFKAGAGYLPLTPETPASRLESILRQSQPKICFCDTSSIHKLQHLGTWAIVNMDLENFTHLPENSLGVEADDNGVAYTVFTSGSTGEPKGVVVTRRNLLGNLQALAQLYNVDPGDRLLQACSQAFDVSVFEIFFAFYTGMCLCAAPKDELFRDIEASIRSLRITHLSLTPTVAALIHPDEVPTVKFLVTAGEGITELVHQRWAGKGLHQGYGPSETTNICTVKMHVSNDDALGNIGYPLPNTSAFVISLQSGFQTLPQGSIGEFAFGGEQVFRGYVGMDEMNAEKLIDHPEFGRIYRSGDIGRMLPDGSLLICGRKDDQIKVRGNRVELGEINNILLKDSNVHDCTTLLNGDEFADQFLVSFVVVEHNHNSATRQHGLPVREGVSVSNLLSSLEGSLPSYMIPRFIVPLTRLPLTSQGKLDRRELQRLYQSLSEEDEAAFGHDYEEAKIFDQWSPEEIEVAAAISDTVDIRKIALRRSRSFFSLGLNSLNAISFAKALEARLSIPVAVSTVLKHSTILRLARVLSKKTPNERYNNNVAMLPAHLITEIEKSCESFQGNVESILPCTPLQEAMLAASANSAASNYYNSLTLVFDGDTQKMKECWVYMIKRHQILRTRFLGTSDVMHPYVQVVLKDSPLPWRAYHLERADASMSTERPTNGREQSVESLPFEMYMQELCQGKRLTLKMHHALYDAISMSTLLHEVELAYRGMALPEPVPLTPFLSEVQRQNSDEAITFWKGQLDGFLPASFPLAANSRQAQEIVLHREMGIDQSDVRALCQRHAVSPLALFQAALVKLLACCQETDDLCFGNVVSGRAISVEGVERLVAPCFNTLPVRSAIGKARQNSTLMQHLNKKNLDMLNYQFTSLRHIQRFSLDPSKRLFDVVLIFQPDLPPLNASIWRKESETGDMGLPLVFEITPVAQKYTLTLHYLDANVATEVAERAVEYYFAALTDCLQHPFSEIKSFHRYDSAEISGCLRRRSGHESISQAVDRWPDVRSSSDVKIIRQVYAQLSGVHESSISGNTSMYEIGLDSLNAPQLASRLRKLGLAVDAVDVIETLTPIALAILIGKKSNLHTTGDAEADLNAFQSEHIGTVTSALGIDEESIELIRPCTSVQSGMLAQSLTSNGRLYVNHITYIVPSDVSGADIKAAWSLVSCRHQILRTGFYQLDNNRNPFAMVIYRPSTTVLPLVKDDHPETSESGEQQISEAIVGSIQNPPWQVRIQERTSGRDMILSLHHALYDARSLGIILADFATALSGTRLPRPTSVDSLLNASLVAEADCTGESAKYWQGTLQDLSIAKFPDLAPTSARESILQSSHLTSALRAETLRRSCKINHATIQALGQTAWALLLAAYTGSENVVFGTVFSGQTTTEAHDVAFPCINTIPVPCTTSQSHQELIQSMVAFNGSSQRHRFLPLSSIQKHGGNADRMLFDTTFVYQKSPAEDSTFGWPMLRESAAVDYCASLELETHSNDDICMRLTHDTAVIPPKQAQLILQQYEHILTKLISGPTTDHKVQESLLSILPPLEPTLSSEVKLLHEFVERNACQHPSRTAFEFVRNSRTETWSYEMLDSIANQVAHLIQRLGISPNSMIAVCMDKCPEASFAFIGILKAGCSFLAIDPDLPESRLRFILEDSGSQLLFGDKADQLPGLPNSIKYFHLTQFALIPLPKHSITRPRVQSGATCYCLYTSGTTGTPKGCEISHENAVQAMLAFMRLFKGRWNESSKWLQFASYWFDVSILEQFWSWAVGITVVGAPRDLILEDIPGFIRKLNITHIDLTPSLARLVQPNEVPSLCNGVFITGGEPLKQEIIKSWGPAKTVCNGYGPTEATIGVTMNTFVGPDAKSSNIGRQFDNVGTYVLHPGSDEPVLRGAIGELCISGKLVGKGYLNRPDLTAKHFPFLDRFNETVYRTGDLVRMLDDNSFTFVGRADSQSKLRGQRLELTEVDSAIRQSSEQIHDVVTLVARTQEGAKETLVSFVTTTADTRSKKLCFDSSTASIHLVQTAKNACTSRLPGYMVPTHILVVNHLPLTVNNKIDAKQLTALFHATSMQELQALQRVENVARALSANEQRICDILRKLLQIDPIAVVPQSNLFSLGLSSISAIPFTRLLKQAGFQNANIGLVVRNHTIEGLSYALSDAIDSRQEDQSTKQARLWMAAFQHRHLHTAANLFEVSVDDIEAVLPCTPLQQGLIIESLKEESRPHFNHFLYEVVDGRSFRLKMCVEKLVGITQILRARFIETDEGSAQVVLQQNNSAISTWSSSLSRLHTILSDLRAQWHSRNDSGLTVPVEFHLIETGNKTYLNINIHHALYDGISFQLMLQQLSDMYQSDQSTKSGPNFGFALAHGPLRSIAGAKDFWKRRLHGTKFNALPGLADGATVGSAILRFPLDNGEAMESARIQLGVSHQAIVQSCFEVALYRCFPSVEVYGVVCSGRSIDLEGADLVVGPMFNTLPRPLRLRLCSSISEHIQSCQLSNAESIPYQHTSLRDIGKWCDHQPSAGIFDVLFVFQHMPKSSSVVSNEVFKPVEDTPNAYYPLACEAEMDDDGCIIVTLLGHETFCNKKVLRDLQSRICETLNHLLDNPNTVLQDIIGATTKAKTSHTVKPAPPPVGNGVQDYIWSANGLRIREIIAELANVDPSVVDEHSSMFALGLDSIDAVRLSSRLQRAGLSITVSKLLKAQTIPRILESVGSRPADYGQNGCNNALRTMQKQIEQTLSHSALEVDDVEQILPSTPFQEGLLTKMLRSNLKQYLNHDVLRLKTDTDIERLVSAWQRVVDKSPILRTSFLEISDPTIDCTFAQVVHAPVPLKLLEFESNDFNDLDEIFENVRLDVLRKTETSPLLRLCLVSIHSEQYLILSLSHALYDGHSIALLHNDVHRAYKNEFELRPGYEDAIDVALDGSQVDARAYWRSILLNRHAQRFPRNCRTDKESITVRAGKCSTIPAAAARAFCKEHSVSMQALAQTCWSITLAHYVRNLDVQFGVSLACRDSEEREQIIFPMMNTVVMRTSLHGSRAQMVQYMQGLMTDMRPYQRTPLREIQSLVKKTTAENVAGPDNGLFDTLFIYQQRPFTSARDTEILYESVHGESTVEYPVAVEIEAVGEKLMTRAACKSCIMDDSGCSQLLGKVDKVLQAIIGEPHRPTVDFQRDQVSLCSLEHISLCSADGVAVEYQASSGEQSIDSAPFISPLLPTIIGVLSEVSKIPQSEISYQSTIESIGVDSISAIKVAALLRKKSISITVSEIVRAKTPARIADVASSARGQDSNTPRKLERSEVPVYNIPVVAKTLGVEPQAIEAVLPATAGQVYMLSMWKKTNGQQFYSTFWYQPKIDSNLERIERAWNALVDRQTILRTVFCAFPDRDGSILQVVLRDATDSFNAQNSMESKQPLVSMKAKTETDGIVLELKIHHAMYDAVSLPLFMDDFQSLLSDQTPEQPKLTFADFHAMSTSPEAKQSQMAFWARYLQNVKTAKLSQPDSPGAQDRVEISKPVLFSGANELEAKARKESLTIQALLFAAYAKVYSNIVCNRTDTALDEEHEDVVIGIYLSNRSHMSELDTLPAPTLNLVPIVVRRPHEQSLVEVANQIQNDLREISTAENSAVGLEEIYEWTGVKVDTFVNFLKLPERARILLSEDVGTGVALEELDDRRTKERCEIVAAKEGEWSVPSALEALRTDAYQHSLDIEMTITDGKLGAGLFCPESLLGLKDGEKVLDDLKTVLDKIVGKEKQLAE